MNRLSRVIPVFILLIPATLPLTSNANGKLNSNEKAQRPAPVTTYNNNNGPVVSFSYSTGPSSEYQYGNRDFYRNQPAPVYQYQYDRGRQKGRDYRQDYHYQPQPYGNRPGHVRPEYRPAPRVQPQSCLGSHCNNTKQ